MAIKNAQGDLEVAIRRMSKMASPSAWLDNYVNREVKIADIEKLCAETLRDFPDLEEEALVAEALRRMESRISRHPLN
jgi:hypothetical protein